jgi:superfamily II DNA or RNA helicase
MNYLRAYIDKEGIDGCYPMLVIPESSVDDMINDKKTVISAFDYKRFKNQNQNAKLLFVAHRKEILMQARDTFQSILRDNNFGELWVDGIEPTSFEYLFASVQTLQNNIESLQLSQNYFDFIIIDEVHHIAAKSYRPILEKFAPKILLGLTATPERMDNENILNDFCDVIATEKSID